ncbi:unnamed protein product [Toxocara canis]|uniref:Major sperm protein n=1 Tax=Toxocara canis TaxID=6265 RepID=A0A183UZ73_TOXCA|nr:unnamed protein product [Toxocara canis]
MQVSTSGGTTKHRLKCIGDQRLAFKVMLRPKYFKYYSKATVNTSVISPMKQFGVHMFKVSPVVGFIQPGATREIMFTRKPGKIGHDYLVIQYIVAPSGYDPRLPFIKGSKVGQLKIKIIAVHGKPKALPENIAKGRIVSDEGQQWHKAVDRDEDEKIEDEVAKQFESPFQFQPEGPKKAKEAKTIEKSEKIPKNKVGARTEIDIDDRM